MRLLSVLNRRCFYLTLFDDNFFNNSVVCYFYAALFCLVALGDLDCLIDGNFNLCYIFGDIILFDYWGDRLNLLFRTSTERSISIRIRLLFESLFLCIKILIIIKNRFRQWLTSDTWWGIITVYRALWDHFINQIILFL